MRGFGGDLDLKIQCFFSAAGWEGAKSSVIEGVFEGTGLWISPYTGKIESIGRSAGIEKVLTAHFTRYIFEASCMLLLILMGKGG